MIAGIDYSMTSPAICVGERHYTMNECKFLVFTDKKKFVGTYKNITCLEYPNWNTNEHRYDLLSQKVLNFLIENDVQKAWIEGYSFGSKGLVFNLQENTGLLKHKMYLNKFPFDVISPPQIKKIQTGKGNQNKEQMYSAWIKDGGAPIQEFFQPKQTKIGSPVSDIVDSYYVMRQGISLEN